MFTVWTVLAGTDDHVIVASEVPTQRAADRIVQNVAEIYEDLGAWVEQD